MENRMKLSDRLITEYYEECRQSVFFYICRRIENRDDAEDLTQDAFLRLLEYRMMIRRDTLKHYLFTVVRNLVNDYLRRYYKRQEIDRYLYDTLPVTTVEPESRMGRKVYVLSRFYDKSVLDISKDLNLSYRTVENHLFISRREVRDFIRQCI